MMPSQPKHRFQKSVKDGNPRQNPLEFQVNRKHACEVKEEGCGREGCRSGSQLLGVEHVRGIRDCLFSAFVQTVPGAHPVSRTMDTGGKVARAWRRGSDKVELTPSLCLHGKLYGEFYLFFS